jgi:predicted ATPase
MATRSQRRRGPAQRDSRGFVISLRLLRDEVPSFGTFPFSIPAVRELDELELHPSVNYFVGENGSGKSTLVEAIAELAGFNPEGGSKNFQFSANRTESELLRYMRLSRGRTRERNGFFLRAESFFNAASYIDTLGGEILQAYGGKSLHEQSHGESFLALAQNKFRGDSLFIMDEPEAALSPSRQLSFLTIMHRLVAQGSQFIIATHSPILMAYPNATIFHLSEDGIRHVKYEDTEHYQITHDFLADRTRFLEILLAPDGDAPGEAD